jgi:hypothetical protein
MENVSHIEMIANQSGKFHEKERFQENIGHGNTLGALLRNLLFPAPES